VKKLNIHITMDNGDEFDVTTRTADYLLWETTSKRHKWGSITENPAMWEAFLAWAALKRNGQYTGPWESFIKDADSVNGIPEEVNPTTEVAGADLS
jgi:hypothetical protein